MYESVLFRFERWHVKNRSKNTTHHHLELELMGYLIPVTPQAFVNRISKICYLFYTNYIYISLFILTFIHHGMSCVRYYLKCNASNKNIFLSPKVGSSTWTYFSDQIDVHVDIFLGPNRCPRGHLFTGPNGPNRCPRGHISRTKWTK